VSIEKKTQDDASLFFITIQLLLIFIMNIINTIVSIAGQAWNLSFSIEKENKHKNISVESQEEPTISVESQEEPTISVESQEEPNTSVESQEEPTISVESQEEPNTSVEFQEEQTLSVERKLNVSHLMPKTTESYTNYLQRVETHIEGPNVRIFLPCNNVWGFAACSCLFVAAFFLRGNLL
jgi:cytoskeletal protein RodZ